MRALTAHVRGGRLVLDEPTELPERWLNSSRWTRRSRAAGTTSTTRSASGFMNPSMRARSIVTTAAVAFGAAAAQDSAKTWDFQSDKVDEAPDGAKDDTFITVVLGLAAFAALTLWKWRLNVVVVVGAGGALGLLRAFAPGLFGGAVVG